MPRAKRPSTSHTEEFGALAKILNFSVLLLDGDTNLKFASANAHTFFGSNDVDELTRRWPEYYEQLKLPDLPRLEKNNKPLNHRTELSTSTSTRLLRMQIYPLRHSDCECYVVFLKDRQVLDDLEQQLLLASHHNVQRYLTSTLVHDLNAPINTMRITLELIERTLSTASLGATSEFTTKWERYKGIFREELAKLKTQVADIPNLFDAAERVVLTAFDVRNVIEDVASFLKHEAASKRIRRELQLPGDPITIHGRQSEVKLALLNVACSLVEATRQGGRIGFHVTSNADMAEVVLSADEAQVDQISVSDYEQSALMSKGNNLGMLVARLIVEAHGGEIRIDISKEHQRVTVRALLPLYISPPR
jgi:nitrogen-specific signal transduction histidine kinase